jgi:hypothetical protein
MTKQKLPAPLEGLSKPVKHADTVEKIVTTVMSGVAAALIPGAGIPLSITQIYLTKKERQLQEILIEQARKGKVLDLSDERLEALVPMGFRLGEAAKQGEYEEVLRVLAAFLRGELEQETPNPSNFAGMARRIQGMSPTDLNVMSDRGVHQRREGAH